MRQKRPLLPKQIWAIRSRLELAGIQRDLALFNFAIDSKLRGCDLVKLAVPDFVKDKRARERVAAQTEMPMRRNPYCVHAQQQKSKVQLGLEPDHGRSAYIGRNVDIFDVSCKCTKGRFMPDKYATAAH